MSDREVRALGERTAAAVAAVREEYAAEIRGGAGGHPAVERYSDRIDALIADIAHDARHLAGVPFAVCALGGYGRRTLCLHSDLDLLVAFDGPIRQREEQLVNALLHPLWDLRFTVGHQVRELAELEELDDDNPEFLLALLDARLLAGDPHVFERVRTHARRAAGEGGRRIRDALVSLVEQRHAGFNDTFYQLEPDIKNAPGGLRDVAAARWLRDLAGDAWAADPRIDEQNLRESESFLLRIRSVLHLESARDANVLTHALQERVADRLAYDGPGPQQRVERLMRDYFRQARSISRTLAWSRRAARGPQPATAPLPAGGNLELTAEGLRFVDPVQAAVDPASWVRAFLTAIERGCAMSDHALSGIHENVGRFGADDFVASEPQREVLQDLLVPRRGLYARLSEMHDCGLLARIFPEFETIHCRVIRDFYHKYTVDEHTLLTLRNVESLFDPPTPSRQRFASLLRELHAPELLTLALLFHDVGKWKDDAHAVESVRMAEDMLDRLKLRPAARHTVTFLIGNHLEMSRVAFRRDAEDPDVVRQFASLAGTEERLKMLCLMTLVDIEAVSPDTLTPWKEELLWRLYVDTYNTLTLGYADDLIDKNAAGLAALRAGRPAEIAEEELSQFLAGLPKRYLALFEPDRIYEHVRLSRNIHEGQVHAALEQKADIWELTVATVDKPYLFSNVSGVLSYFGMDILRGQAMTTPAGLVLDVFQFTDADGFLRLNPEARSEIHRLLDEAVSGTTDVTSLLRGKQCSVLYRRRRSSPVVHFDHQHSQKYSVLEIVADDAPCLLHRISRVISDHCCDLDLALILTEGEKAIDVLHVTKEGRKLSDAEQTALAAALIAVLVAGEERV